MLEAECRQPIDSLAGRADPAVAARWQADGLILERPIEVMREVPLFGSLSKGPMRSLSRMTSVSTCPRSATIVSEGDQATYFFVIVDGTARVVKGDTMLGKLAAGDFFGEIGLLDPGPRTAGVVAETDLRCVKLDRTGFVTAIEREPKIATRLLAELAKRLRQADARLATLTG